MSSEIRVKPNTIPPLILPGLPSFGRVSFFVESVLLGLVWSRFREVCRDDRPLDSEWLWSTFARPSSTGWQARLETVYPTKVMCRLYMMLYHQSSYFRQHAVGIESHYDLSNDFYKLFLDRDYMFYSYGDFSGPYDSLEEAQLRKADFIADLISPQPEDKILDMGCGWGAMMHHIVGRTNSPGNILGYTLSKEQKVHIEANYGYRVELVDAILADLGHEQYDKIYSIGFYEHVRGFQLADFAKRQAAALRSGGRLVHHYFCLADYPPPAAMLPGIEVFPGSECSTLGFHLNAFESAGLKVVSHTIHDYRPTLRCWFDRLASNRAEALKLVSAGTYNKYLAYFAIAWRLFNERFLIPNRIALEKDK